MSRLNNSIQRNNHKLNWVFLLALSSIVFLVSCGINEDDVTKTEKKPAGSVETKRFIYTGGVINYYTDIKVDSTGRTLEINVYNDAGLDGEWDTSDDVFSGGAYYTYDSSGRKHTEVSGLIGADKKWRTGDDVIFRVKEFRYPDNETKEHNFEVWHSLPGPDGDFLTSDDILERVYETRPDPMNSNHMLEVLFNDPGPDGIWFNSNDVIQEYVRHIYDSNQNKIAEYILSDSGLDTIWFNSDDRSGADNFEFVYNAANRVVRETNIDQGADEIPGNLDDSVGDYFSTYYLATDTAYSIWYNGQGMDGNWYTGDDTKRSLNDYVYDEDGNLVSITFYDPGPDNISFTPDDTVTGYYKFSYDSKGILLGKILSRDAGADGAWFTSDDLIADRSVYSYVFEAIEQDLGIDLF